MPKNHYFDSRYSGAQQILCWVFALFFFSSCVPMLPVTLDRMVALIDLWLTPTLAIFQLYRGARKIETYNKDLLWTVPSDYLYKITYWLRWHSRF
jgi:hypothetical protein